MEFNLFVQSLAFEFCCAQILLFFIIAYFYKMG